VSSEPMAELRRNLNAEWGKSWSIRVPSLWLVACGLICLVTAIALANDFVHSISTGEESPNARMPVIDALGSAVTFAQIAGIGFGIHLVTPELASGSIGPTFMAQPRRWVVIVAKALTGAVSAGFLGLATGALAARGIEFVLDAAVGPSTGLVTAGIGTAVIFACSAVVGVSLAFLFRSAVGALCAGFALLVVTVATPEPVDGWLPGPAQASWFADLTAGHMNLRGIEVLLIWTSGLLVIAMWVVRRRDA
jgi:ABC-2 type transport system permease protein